MQDAEGLTQLLLRWRDGDGEAGNQLWSVVIREMRRLAASHMRRERSDHTLQATALINEVFLRLFASQPIDWKNRAHFFAVAARQMRRILVNHARDLHAKKRGDGGLRVLLTDLQDLAAPAGQNIIQLEEALTRLEQLDERAAQIVDLRFFGGLTEKEAAEVLGISTATAKRDWDFARTWLLRQLVSS